MNRGGKRHGAGRPFRSKLNYPDAESSHILDDRLAADVVDTVLYFLNEGEPEAIRQRIDRATSSNERVIHEERSDFWDAYTHARQQRSQAEAERDGVLLDVITKLNLTQKAWNELPVVQRKVMVEQHGFSERLDEANSNLRMADDELLYLESSPHHPRRKPSGARAVTNIPLRTKAQLTAAFAATAAVRKLGLNVKQVASYWKRWHSAARAASASDYQPGPSAHADGEDHS